MEDGAEPGDRGRGKKTNLSREREEQAGKALNARLGGPRLTQSEGLTPADPLRQSQATGLRQSRNLCFYWTPLYLQLGAEPWKSVLMRKRKYILQSDQSQMEDFVGGGGGGGLKWSQLPHFSGHQPQS